MKFRPALAALLVATAAVPAALSAQMAAGQNWNLATAETGKGHRVGNPDAAVQLIAFVSYTCPHCAHYETQSDAAMRAGYIHEGRVALEVRHVIRNVVDIAAAASAECGPADQFWQRHRALAFSHESWIAKAQAATPAQTARWNAGPIGQRLRAIADDLDFHEIMEPAGLDRTTLDQCLNDEAKARAILAASEANSVEFAVPGTPSFVINGSLQAGVHSWDALQPLLDAGAPPATGG